jgi:type IV secretory pathway VirB10-like protein
MLDEVNERAVAGDNNPPPFDPAIVEELNTGGQAFLEAAATWIENGDLETEDDATRLNDFIAGIKARVKAADDERVKAKKPHDLAGKAVQAAFKPVIDKMERAKTVVQPLLTTWLQKKRAEKDAEAARQRAAAKAAQEEADRKAAAAEARNDISGQVDAEAAREAADKATKDAERLAKRSANVGSATGGGRTASLRTVIEAEVLNARVLFMRYQDRPEVLEVLRSLATREARSAGFNAKTDTIPGAKITTTKKAV